MIIPEWLTHVGFIILAVIAGLQIRLIHKRLDYIESLVEALQEETRSRMLKVITKHGFNL
jgi:hypothetical protein